MIQVDSSTNANKYFIVVKLSIETQISKLIEIALCSLQKLIYFEFLFYQSQESLYSINDSQGVYNENKQLIVLAVVDALCWSSNAQDELVQDLILQTLLTVTT